MKKINDDVLTVQTLIIWISGDHLIMILAGKAGGNYNFYQSGDKC